MTAEDEILEDIWAGDLAGAKCRIAEAKKQGRQYEKNIQRLLADARKLGDKERNHPRQLEKIVVIAKAESNLAMATKSLRRLLE